MFEIDKGFNKYVWEGTWEDQPTWWFTLLQHARSFVQEINNKKVKNVRNATVKNKHRHRWS